VKRTIEVVKKQPKAQVRIRGGTAESSRSAPTLGAATLRELRARPICGNRIKVAAYQRRQWIRFKRKAPKPRKSR